MKFIKARCNDCGEIFEEWFEDDTEFVEYGQDGLPLSCCDKCTTECIGEVIEDLKSLGEVNIELPDGSNQKIRFTYG